MEQEKMLISTLDFERIMHQIEETEKKYTTQVANLQHLKAKLLTAKKVKPQEIASNIITMGTIAEIKTGDDNFSFNLKLVYPAFENVRENKISIFSNLGTAIFLQKPNDVIQYYTWQKEHDIKILKIQYQPEAVGDFDT